MDESSIITALDHLARRQAGTVAAWQLRALGSSAKQTRRVAAQHALVVDPGGVWTLPGCVQSEATRTWRAILAVTPRGERRPPPADELLDRVRQVHVAATRGVLATGFTAAAHLRVVPNAPTRPQVLIAHQLTKEIPGIRVVRTRRFPSSSIDGDGVPCVPAHRVLVDTAWLIRRERQAFPRMRRLATAADGLRLLKAEDLHLVLADPAAHDLPGRLPVLFKRVASSLVAGHSHSGAEAIARRIVTEEAAALGVVAEQRPLSLPDEHNAVGEADIAVVALLLDIEVDGPHHDEPDQQRYDRWRDAQLRALGWTVVRFSDRLVRQDPERFRALVSAALLAAIDRQTAAAVV